MSVNDVLDKISKHNDSVVGCVLAAKGTTYHNLPDIYSMVDFDGVSEYAQSIFDVTAGLEGDTLDQIFFEFQSHSIYARRVDETVLVLINKPIPRTVFKKMQVGVNLFVKPLERAIEKADAADAAPPPPAAEPEAPKDEPPRGGRIGRMYRGVRY